MVKWFVFFYEKHDLKVKIFMNKILILIFLIKILSGCANSLAFLGPASSVVGGGNIAQSAVSSAVSYGVKKQTGMSPTEHAVSYVQKNKLIWDGS